MTMMTRTELARMVDHTLLATTATTADVAALVSEARDLATYAICVSPSMLPLPVPSGEVKVGTVCGFPSGKHTAAVKAAEAAEAVRHGAAEVDMVIDVGALKEHGHGATEAEIREVREATGAPTVLKVIIEAAALTDAEIVTACQAAEAAGADFVKTSTGFHPAGGASVHAVRLMAQTVGQRLGVKASGGIRDWATAVALVVAGATRLGLSGTRAVLDGQPTAADY
ncbi:MAG: deoxyribose-phosphate aldolase [Propioniciclava sp.]